MVNYVIADKLGKNPAIHCATLVITEDVLPGDNWPALARPDAALRNGTLTFVKSAGRTYAVTCNHVVQHLRDVQAASGDLNSHSMRTMLNGFYIVQDHFIQPQVQFGDQQVDIAIRKISPDHIAHLGKEALDLDVMREPPEELDFALAVGFPEALKYHKADGPLGYRVSMPQVQIVAGLSSRPYQRFTMFSELQEPPLDVDYSGMSGGPIFWSTGEEYGILGIIYEGGPGDDNTIYVYGEFASAEVIKGWIEQCDAADGGGRAV